VKQFFVPESGAEEGKTPTFSKKRLCYGIKDWGIEEKGLRVLHGKGMVEGVSNLSLDIKIYEHCLYQKKNWVILSFRAIRAKRILELVHSDVLGPVYVPSLGKFVYYVSFIDDFLRNTWIYFLQKKSEVFVKFHEFKALVEN
jgi:hypothetical protein